MTRTTEYYWGVCMQGPFMHYFIALLSFTLKLTIVTILLSLPATQSNHLQLVLNSAACAVTKTPKYHHINPILNSLHGHEMNERIKYKVLCHL